MSTTALPENLARVTPLTSQWPLPASPLPTPPLTLSTISASAASAFSALFLVLYHPSFPFPSLPRYSKQARYQPGDFSSNLGGGAGGGGGGGGLLSGGGLGEHRSVPGGSIASSGPSGYGGLRKEGSFGSGAGSAYGTPASSLPAASGSRFGRLAQFGMNQAGSGSQVPQQQAGQGQGGQPNSLVGYGRHKF
jgi:hypothetical protein